MKDEHRLQDGDVILVILPVTGYRYNTIGKVKRPMFYENETHWNRRYIIEVFRWF